MTIFIEPDELRSNSRFPPLDTVQCAGLEIVTGADFVVSTLPAPILPINALEKHIEAGSYFVQRKSGYDALSFDQLKRSIARMKQVGIPQKQAVLLLIGDYSQGKNGKLQVDGKIHSDTPYSVFCEIQMLWAERGGTVYHLGSEEELEAWIAGYYLMRDNVRKGDKAIYPDKTNLSVRTDESGFQVVEEVPADDLRSLLCRGLPNFGPTLAENTVEALRENGFEETLFNAFLILTTLTAQKPLWKIKGIGLKTVMEIRRLLYNKSEDWSLALRYRSIDEEHYSNYTRGYFGALEDVTERIAAQMKNGNKINIKGILTECKATAEEFTL